MCPSCCNPRSVQNFNPKDGRSWRNVLCNNPNCRHSSSVQRWLCPCKSAWRSCRIHSSWLLHTNVAAEHASFKGLSNKSTAKRGMKRTISSLDFLCHSKIASDLLAANIKRSQRAKGLSGMHFLCANEKVLPVGTPSKAFGAPMVAFGALLEPIIQIQFLFRLLARQGDSV